MRSALPPILFPTSEAIGVKQAAARTGKSITTIRRLVAERELGRQTFRGAPVEICWPALLMAVHGDPEAIELLRDGNRSDPRVKRYLDYAAAYG